MKMAVCASNEVRKYFEELVDNIKDPETLMHFKNKENYEKIRKIFREKLAPAMREDLIKSRRRTWQQFFKGDKDELCRPCEEIAPDLIVKADEAGAYWK
jgi:hypothetical protein